MNWYVLFISAAIPLVTGYIWYHPSIFGKAWMKASGVNPYEGKRNMFLIFFLTYLFGLFLSTQLMSIVVHQMHVYSIFADTPGAMDAGSEMMLFLEHHGSAFRSFGHGAFHGFIAGVAIALPIFGILALYEKRNGRYIFIHAGYWILTLMLMGGLLCAML